MKPLLNGSLSRYAFVYLIFSFILSPLLANDNLSFVQLSLKNGLSQSTVYDIIQDEKGCLWIATADGLNKYDGYKFTVYRQNKKDTTSLFNNQIRSLCFTPSNQLWIGTQNGISKYDKNTECFINYPAKDVSKKLNVYHIEALDEETFLLGTNIGLYKFDKTKRYQALSFKYFINTLISINKKHFIGSEKGLFYYDMKNDQYNLAHKELENKRIMVITPHNQDKNKIWIGTEGDGLYLYDMQHNSIKNYIHEKNNSTSISSNYIRSLCYDNSGRLWIGTFVGLNIATAAEGVFQRHYNDYYSAGEISQNSIRALYRDTQGGMWCGTYFGGLNYYHPSRNRFEHYGYERYTNSLNDNVVSVILPDGNDNLWIGTNDNGLNYYNATTNRFTYYKQEELNPNSLSGNNVKTLLRKNDNELYVGTHGGGLSLFSHSKGQFKRINISNSPVANNGVYALVRINNEIIWIGTLDGLIVYNEKTGKTEYIDDNNADIAIAHTAIMSMKKDSKNRVWIGTDNGIALYDLTQDVFMPINSSFKNNRYTIAFSEDKQGNIWVGTTNGLLLYDNSTKVLKDCEEEFGFPDYTIYGILDDNFDRLWLSTNNGLFSLNPDSRKWRQYLESDGIQSNQFNMYSYCKTPRGKMYFGGINGITAFYPERLIDNPYTPKVIIDKLTVFNKAVKPQENENILERSIENSDKIFLQSSQSLFGLEFVVPNFLSGKKNTFAYTLEGFDNEWYYTDKTNVSYSNLNPGKYTFKIKAANNDGKWSDEITQLQIVILPEWWQTWWAKLLYIAIILTILVFIGRFYLGKKLVAQELQLARLEKEKNEELNQAKIRFFINISHEFRTPLTLIMSPIQEILQRGITDKWVRDQLRHVQRNADRMLHLINQVLDYRRSELGVLELHVSKQPITPFAQEIYDLFKHLAEQKKIQYTYHSFVGEKEYYFDKNYVERILSNLISNAFKFTPNGRSIEIVIKEADNQLLFRVQDTGCGIPEEKQSFIFDRFYQVEENSNGTGIGLSLTKNLIEKHHGKIMLQSTMNEGSLFTVYLPQELSVYKENELVHTTQIMEGAPHISKNISHMVPLNDTEGEPVYDKTDGKEHKYKLLLVEDDDEIRKYLSDSFAADYQVIVAENGKVAWNILNENIEVDIIVSDVMMPETDGIKLCKMIKQNIRFCHIPIILLTAKTDINDQIEGLSIGADDYIGKPFVFSILRTKTINILKSRQRTLQHYSTSSENDISELTSNPLDEEFLKKAIGIIEKNMEDPEFSTEDFSREMGMSRSNLYLKLKALTNESAIEFIRRIRFGYACKLLKEGRYNVSEISSMVGFTPSYFATSFKKYMGCLPSEYVKNKQFDKSETNFNKSES